MSEAQAVNGTAATTERSERLGRPNIAGFFRHHGVWAPGVRLFRNVDFRIKACFISAAFFIPIVVLAWQFYVTGQRLRDATQGELAGMALLAQVGAVSDALNGQRFALMAGKTEKPDLARIDPLLLGLQKAFEGQVTIDGSHGVAAVKEAHAATLKAAPSDAEQALQGYIDAVGALGRDVEDASGLSRDPDVDASYLQSIAFDVIPDAIESLERARAMAAQHHAKKATPDAASGHQLFAMTAWSGRQLMKVQSSIDRVAAVNAEAAAKVPIKESMEVVWGYAGAANESWFGTPFKGDSPELQAASAKSLAALSAIREGARSALAGVLQQRMDRIDRVRFGMLCVLAAALGLAAYLFYSFYLVINGGLGEVRRHLVAMTGGDLTSSPRPWGRDEAAMLMVTLAEMQDSLRQIVHRVRGSSESIVQSSSAISSVSSDLSSRTEQTSNSLEQAAGSMEHISSTVQRSAEDSQVAAGVAAGNAEAASRGGQVIDDVVHTMLDIHDQSRKIGEIIGTIDGIAFQTNILALNAAVEAARAGEQGRGFAVVAGEVRNLAARSAQAAREIKSLIGSTVDKVESGTRIVKDAGTTMKELVASAERMNTLMSGISTAAKEQSRGVVQVGDAVKEIDAMTQRNAALVDQTASAASSLKSQAVDLANEVSKFRLP